MAGGVGCARSGGGVGPRPLGESSALGPGDARRLQELGPFAPDTIRVFPLTHVEATDAGAQIVLHLELRDRWGDTVKATGQLRVRLYRGAGGRGDLVGTARQRQELVWDVDLTDLGLNAALFDPSTRTYRVVLGDLPAWSAGLVDGGGGQAVTLVVVWIGRDADGDVVSLRDLYQFGG